MKTQLSSLDIYFVLKELKNLENSRVDKIYNNGKEEIYIQLHKSNVGKNVLRVIIGKAVFLSETKAIETPSEFCMLLRKHLEGKFLDSMEQLEPERILKFIFKSKDETKKLYLEFFGKGNAILCNNDDIVIDSLIHHKFKDRSIFPKEKYRYPSMQYNLFKLDKNQLADLCRSSKKDKIITSLAVEFGLGGTYSEEVCLLGSIDKNTQPKNINENEIKKIIDSIEKIIKNKKDPRIICKGKEAVDVTPINLEFYKDFEKKKFSGFNEALDTYYTKELKLAKKEESVYEKQIKELRRIIEEQKDTMVNLKNKEGDFREKGEFIYKNYQMIKEILGGINEASKKHSWEEIKRKLKGHGLIKDIDIKEKKIIVELKNGLKD